MSRNLKALGLALAAVFALGAISAQGAFAAGENCKNAGEQCFHADAEHVILTGHRDETVGAQKTAVLTLGTNLKVECANTTIEGTETGVLHKNEVTGETWTVQSATVRPDYYGEGTQAEHKKCDSFLGKETVEVKTNMCHYTLGSETPAEEKALATVICPKGESIEILGGGLTIKLTGGPENLFEGKEVNKNLKGVHYTSTGATTNEKDITVKSNVTGIHFTCAPAFSCGLVGVATTGNNAGYVGDVTVQGFADKGGETTSYLEGEQVGIWQGPTT